MKFIFIITLFFQISSFHHCSSSSSSSPSQYYSTKPYILPLRVSKMPSMSLLQRTSSSSRPLNKLSFHHNVTLTVSLQVGTPPQNVSMVLDTGSELSWLNCNSTNLNQSLFHPTRSATYSNVSCSDPTCYNRTRDFPIPVSCDSARVCHATLSYADMSSSEGSLATDTFWVGSSQMPATVFGCMDSASSSDPDQDSKTTGLMGMNRGSLSLVSQTGIRKFSYCISGSDFLGVLLLGDANFTWVGPLNYTPLIQISNPLPYFNRVAYTVQLEGIRVGEKPLQLPASILEPDHTGAGQTMVDSGTQFTFLLGPVYDALRTEFLKQTNRVLRALDEADFVFQGGMDLCYLIPVNQTGRAPPLLPTVTLVFNGADMAVSGERLLYRVPGEVRGGDGVHCFTFGNSDLLGVESYVIGHHHQQNVWMEFDLENSRIGLAKVRCDLALHHFNMPV